MGVKEVLLKDIRHEYHQEDLVCEWDFIAVNNTDIRLYYKQAEENGMGFSFYAIERTSFIDMKKWDKDTDSIECVIQGIAYFDGIRHLYYGDEKTSNYGYHYYANIEAIIKTLRELRNLEIKYCNYCD